MKNKVLITGATGSTGKNAVESLLELKVPVRAFVHSFDERSEELSRLGAEIVQGDLLDFESVSAAMKGVTGAYFVYPIKVPGILEATAFFAEAALENGIKSIVNMSQISARRLAQSHASLNHWIAERLFDRTGIPVTHLRPTFFAEWLKYQATVIKAQSRLVLPFGNGLYAPIAAEDQGRVIAAILADPAPHAGRIYSLFGAQEITQFDIAEKLSEVLGRKIDYVPIEIEDFKQVMKDDFGFTPWFIQHVSAVAQDCRDGRFAGTNNVVEQLTGRKPLSVTDYIVKHKSIFG